jgi:putative membrane protein
MTLLVVWLINTLALILVAYLMPSISVAGFFGAIIYSIISWALSALLLR